MPSFTLYLDGKVCASLKDTKVVLKEIGNESRYLLGRTQSENAAFYKGLLDNFTIRSSALSADEVAELVEIKEHEPLSAIPLTITTKVNQAPELPKQIRVLYTDGIYEWTDVTWETIEPEKYDKIAIFTVNGVIDDTVSAKAEVLVVSGDETQLEQLPDTAADSISNRRITGKASVSWNGRYLELFLR